jgi:hypothetical protein
MAVTGAGAARFATAAERGADCIFACDFTDLGRVLHGGQAVYTFAGTAPFVTRRDGALFDAANDAVNFYYPELGKQIRGTATPLTIIARISTSAFLSGTNQIIVATDGGLYGQILGIGSDASTTDKTLVLFRNSASNVSTATISAGDHVVAASVTAAGVVTFYCDGVQLGNTLPGALGPPTLGEITVTAGNSGGGGLPLNGRLKYLRMFRRALPQAEIARYTL